MPLEGGGNTLDIAVVASAGSGDLATISGFSSTDKVDVTVFGAGQYAMRLWVKPDQLSKLGITVPDIVAAVQAQNTVNPAGQMGGTPAPKRQEYTWSVRAQGWDKNWHGLRSCLLLGPTKTLRCGSCSGRLRPSSLNGVSKNFSGRPRIMRPCPRVPPDV